MCFGDLMGLDYDSRVKRGNRVLTGFKCWNHGGRGTTIGSVTFPAAAFPRMGGHSGASFSRGTYAPA